MKRLLSLMVVLVLTCSLIACSNSDDKETSGDSKPAVENTKDSSADSATKVEEKKEVTESEDPIRVGVFFKDSTTMFWRYIASGCQEKASELGIEFIEYSPSSYTDSAGQMSMLEDAIESGIDAICIAAIDSTAVVDTLLKAEDAGIPVIVFNTLIPDFAASGRQRTFIGIDNYTASYEVTDKILSEYNYECNLVILEGTPATQMNYDRTDPIYAIAEKNPGVNIVAVQPCYANRETAMTTMENILQTTKDIDVVWALNDPTALGALQAIEAENLDGIDIVSIDGTPEAAVAIMNGRGLKYTMDQAPFDMGALAVQAAYDAIQGKTLEEKIFCGGTCIGPDNAKSHLETYYPDYKY